MKKVVLDTNTIISGLLWDGNESAIIRKAEQKEIIIFTSELLLKELEKVLQRDKFQKRLKNKKYSIKKSIKKIRLLFNIVEPKQSIDTIKNDPDDNRVLECAVCAKADIIVSGDNDLLNLKNYLGINIITAKKFLEIV